MPVANLRTLEGIPHEPIEPADDPVARAIAVGRTIVEQSRATRFLTALLLRERQAAVAAVARARAECLQDAES